MEYQIEIIVHLSIHRFGPPNILQVLPYKRQILVFICLAVNFFRHPSIFGRHMTGDFIEQCFCKPTRILKFFQSLKV